LDDTERVELATALRDVLRTAKERDVLSAAIVALAKIGGDGLGWSLSASFVPFLSSHDQELRETAALALGIAGQPLPEVVQVLLGLVADDRDGRRLSGDVPVNERTRAFAAFAMGLLLARRPDLATTHRVVTQLLRIVEQPDAHGRDLQVAAIEALALLPNDWSGPAEDSLRLGIAQAFRRYYEAERGSGDQLLQAHVPVALARLLPPGSDLADAWRSRCQSDLRRALAGQPVAGHSGRSGPFLTQSLVLALGELGRPWSDPLAMDAPIGALLLQTYRECRDEQTRSFALLSIARLGGNEARRALLDELGRAGKAIEQPWCAMALGVLEARRRTQASARGPTPEPDAELRAALQAAFDTARNPNGRAALAVALGLTGDPAAATPLRRALPEHRMQDDVAGYLSLALGMLGDPRALGELRLVFRSAQQRPFLRMQSIRALGLLGDVACVDELCQQLREGGRSLTQLAATALALGEIGDRRAIAPLLQIVRDPACVALGRAFAVAALGTIADKDPLPWNAPYASHGNYRAATSTLTDGQSGVLDIL
jgi:HEAT repeat protein